MTNVEPFTAEDFAALSAFALDAWQSGLARDWSVPAGTLEWSCFETADHTIDCVFSYAFFLASRARTAYPPFGEVHALPEASPADLVDPLRELCQRLMDHTADWPFGEVVRTDDPWSDLLQRSGRALV